MFSGVMVNAWIAGSLVGVVAGCVGFFVVARGDSFSAHAVPLSSFAGAAGAGLVGLSAITGLVVVAPVSALAIGWLGARRQRDVVTALVVAAMLGVGSLFLSWRGGYAAQVYGLLFGDIFGISAAQLLLTACLAASGVLAIGLAFRPLLLTSASGDVAAARGVGVARVEVLFVLLVALVTTSALPVVGALLVFVLMVGPPAGARAFARAPLAALVLGTGFSLVTVWVSLAAAYLTSWPVGFFVGVLGAAWYLAGRVRNLTSR